jgi:hypoxanthine-DNA glycosylase
MTVSACFPPQVDRHTRVLVLGSLPGRASLAAGQYYAHPRNHFWRLMGDILQLPLQELPYEDRICAMLASGVGLWDVVAQAQRKGSLDADLKQVTYNDLLSLLATLPALKAVAFNGMASGRAGRFLSGTRLALLQFPSSSPAMTMAYASKLDVWLEIKRYL